MNEHGNTLHNRPLKFDASVESNIEFFIQRIYRGIVLRVEQTIEHFSDFPRKNPQFIHNFVLFQEKSEKPHSIPLINKFTPLGTQVYYY